MYMYVCMYVLVCMYTCMYLLCMCTYLYVCMYACVYVCVLVYKVAKDKCCENYNTVTIQILFLQIQSLFVICESDNIHAYRNTTDIHTYVHF